MPKICESAVNTHESAVNMRDFIVGILGTVYAFFSSGLIRDFLAFVRTYACFPEIINLETVF